MCHEKKKGSICQSVPPSLVCCAPVPQDPVALMSLSSMVVIQVKAEKGAGMVLKMARNIARLSATTLQASQDQATVLLDPEE